MGFFGFDLAVAAFHVEGACAIDGGARDLHGIGSVFDLNASDIVILFGVPEDWDGDRFIEVAHFDGVSGLTC